MYQHNITFYNKFVAYTILILIIIYLCNRGFMNVPKKNEVGIYFNRCALEQVVEG